MRHLLSRSWLIALSTGAASRGPGRPLPRTGKPGTLTRREACAPALLRAQDWGADPRDAGSDRVDISARHHSRRPEPGPAADPVKDASAPERRHRLERRTAPSTGAWLWLPPCAKHGRTCRRSPAALRSLDVRLLANRRCIGRPRARRTLSARTRRGDCLSPAPGRVRTR